MSDKSSVAHKFWTTQPVPQPGAPKSERVGPVDKPKTVEDVSTEPLSIPSTFEWWTPNLEDPEDLRVIYELLRDNYVEDSESIFRFKYSMEFLRWAMTPPGYNASWHVGVRRKSDKMMLGFVSGIPIKMRMGTPKRLLKEGEEGDYLEPRTICEINFLCVHKMLREKRVAPILIQEVTRRVNLTSVWQAIYTSGTLLPTPFSTAQYFHRSLNIEKLLDVSFSSVPKSFQKFQNPKTMLKRFFQLPEETKTNGLRPMEAKDVPQVTKLLREKLASYDVGPVFSEEDVAHNLLPREELLTCYVVEREVADDEETGNGNNGDNSNKSGKKNKNNGGNGDESRTNNRRKTQKRVTDFFSFYLLPSTVIGNSKYSILNAVYVYYYVANSIPVSQLINDLLIIAFKKGYDVCNVVEIAESRSFLNDLLFVPGDGYLRYYFYNWDYPETDPSKVALFML